MKHAFLSGGAGLVGLAALAFATGGQEGTDEVYTLLVAAESADEVYEVRFDGDETEVVARIPVGYFPTEIEGPHGLAVEEGGEHWYVSIAHGNPYGHLLKVHAESREVVGKVQLGLFPATMEFSPATGLLYCVNFDLHGDMTPSTVSVIDTDDMVEIAQTTTGSMPHGSSVSPDGLKHYSCAMMSGQLYEMDALTFEVLRVIDVVEAAKSLPRIDTDGMEMAMPTATEMADMHAKAPKPTWVEPHPLLPFAYVALNGANEILEVDLETWVVTRRFATPAGPYNLAVTPDGSKLVVTYKGAQSVGFWDLENGAELGRAETTRAVTHGVVVSPDGQYAFVTSEGRGAEPGALDVFYLESYTKIASAEVGLQAGGVALLSAPSGP